MHKFWYKLEGKKAVECDVTEGAAAFSSDRQVALTQRGDICVSTVFLGLDHNFSDHGPPLLFGTMVFGGHCDEDCLHYSTWEEAEAGHAQICRTAFRWWWAYTLLNFPKRVLRLATKGLWK